MLTSFLFPTQLTAVKEISLPLVPFPVAVPSPFGWTNRWLEAFPFRRGGAEHRSGFQARFARTDGRHRSIVAIAFVELGFIRLSFAPS